MNSDIVSKEAFVISLPFFFRYLTVWFVSVPENKLDYLRVWKRAWDQILVHFNRNAFHEILITKLKITVQKSEKNLFGINLWLVDPLAKLLLYYFRLGYVRSVLDTQIICTFEDAFSSQSLSACFRFPDDLFLFTKGKIVKQRHPLIYKSTSLSVLFLQSLFSSLNLCYRV